MSEFKPGQYSNLPNNYEDEIANNFLMALAQPQDDTLEDILNQDDGGGEGNLDAQMDGEEALPDIDTDQAETEAIGNLIKWDKFVILFDPHYANKMEEDNQLPEPKAKAKSFMLYYEPENKRVEGVVNKKYVGGYKTKEELGEDLTFLKSLSEEGFSPDWKEKLFRDIDELPMIENENLKSKVEEKGDKIEEEEEKKAEDEEKLVDGDEENNQRGTDEKEGPSGQELPPPSPVGSVETSQQPRPASRKELTIRRLSRLKAMRSIK